MSKQSRFAKTNIFRRPKHTRFGKVFKNKEQVIEFPCFSLLGGNRRDPLNLNELIQRKKQATVHMEHEQMNTLSNDPPIEILLQPNIFDPLCLEVSLRNNQHVIPLTSTNQYMNTKIMQKDFQQPINWYPSDDQYVPPTKFRQYHKY